MRRDKSRKYKVSFLFYTCFMFFIIFTDILNFKFPKYFSPRFELKSQFIIGPQKQLKRSFTQRGLENNRELLKELFEDPIIFLSESIGDIRFLNDDSLPQKIKSRNYEKCKLCNNFTDAKDGNSTPRDLILCTIYMKAYNNLVQLPRMLRSVGSRASIVYFMEQNTIDNMDKEALKDIEDCGVTIVPIMQIHERYLGISHEFQKHSIFYTFVRRYKNEFDRVICMDAFDSMFQKDPFWEGFDSDHAVLSTEGDKIINNRYNYDWYRALVKEPDKSDYSSMYTICAGVVAGGVDAFVEFYKDYINLNYAYSVGTRSSDQGILNYLFYNNGIKNAKIDFDFNMISATAFFIPDERKDGLFYTTPSNKTPRLIHQYDRVCSISQFINKNCKISYGRNYEARTIRVLQGCHHTEISSNFVG